MHIVFWPCAIIFFLFTPSSSHPHAHHARLVQGLGDTNYDKFCHMGKGLDSRLGDVGGTR